MPLPVPAPEFQRGSLRSAFRGVRIAKVPGGTGSASTKFRTSVELEVRFPEVDAQGVVWHGNYLRYLDLAREALFRQGGLSARRFLETGYSAPIVECELHYKAPLRLDDRARVELELAWEGVPRLDIAYEVVRLSDGVVACEATTRQVLTDPKGALVLGLPDFVKAWAARLGLETS